MEKELLLAAFNAVVNSTKNLVFLKDKNLVYRAASMAFVRMTGKTSVDEVVGHSDLEIFEDKRLAKRYIYDDNRLIRENRDLIDYVEPITDDNGNARYGSTSKYLLRNKSGEVIGILGVTRDITKDYLARQRYQQEFRYLFELPSDTYAVCYIDVDDWRVICQRRQMISTGTLQEGNTVEEIVEYAIDSIIDKQSSASEFYKNFSSEKLHEIYSSGRRTLNFKYERELSDNTKKWVSNEIDFLTDVDSGHLCVMLSAKDINAIKREQQKLEEAAKLDSMTKIYNHKTAMETIRKILETENDRQHALFMLDVDNFKSLNDTLGHQCGDEFLIELAQRLKSNFRESDVIGRIGGDEFFALMRNVFEKEQVERKARDILEIVAGVAEKYPQVNLSGSVGIGLYPTNGTELEELYAKSDHALYEAKKSGKNTYVFYSGE